MLHKLLCRANRSEQQFHLWMTQKKKKLNIKYVNALVFPFFIRLLTTTMKKIVFWPALTHVDQSYATSKTAHPHTEKSQYQMPQALCGIRKHFC